MSRLQFVFDDFEIVVYEEYASYKLQNCKQHYSIVSKGTKNVSKNGFCSSIMDVF